MPSPEKAVQALQAATDAASIRAALLDAARYNNAAHPAVQAAVREAQRLLTRLKRVALLMPTAPTPLPVERQASHEERMNLLVEIRLKRALGVDTRGTERKIKDACRDSRCTQCELSPTFRAVCMQYLLECIAIRCKTRVSFDVQNGYAIAPDVTAFMQRLAHDPLSAWLDDSATFFALPARLQAEYTRAVVPSMDGTRRTRKEAGEYRRHATSIAKMVAALRRCELAAGTV